MNYRFGARNQGFWLTFNNGYKLSTQFGPGNYCGNYPDTDFRIDSPCESDDVEIAVVDKNRSWVTKEVWLKVFGEELSDDVKGFVTFEQWLKLVKYLETL